jgi:hypothetical protein
MFAKFSKKQFCGLWKKILKMVYIKKIKNLINL